MEKINAEILQNLHHFIKWKEEFLEFYLSDEIDQELFGKHCLLIIIINAVLLLQKNENIQKNLIETNQLIRKELEIPEYFDWIFENEKLWCEIEEFQKKNLNTTIIIQDLFSDIYQQLIAHTSRHAKGEFYTHPILARMMVESSYQEGISVLDPACGSGTFLIEVGQKIITNQESKEKQISAIMKLVGMDCNPLACIMARANFLLFTQFHFHQPIIPRIFLTNALFPSTSNKTLMETLKQRFELIIGNPPWLVLNRIMSKAEKERVKELGNELNVLIGGKLATSTELTTIFWAKSVRDYLVNSGIIHFVVPASLANAAQHDRFRTFEHVSEVEFWAFDQDAFRIHNLCVKAKKLSGELRKIDPQYKVRWKTYHVALDAQETSKQIILLEEAKFKPVSITQKKGTIYCGRYMDELRGDQKENDEKNSLVPETSINSSIYQKEFRQGASLVPRNLIFISIDNNTISPNSLMNVHPDLSINPKKYSTWEFQAFDTAQIESKYIFSVAKSTGLLPYQYVESSYAFLPIEFENKSQKYLMKAPSQPAALAHYRKISQLFQEHMKEGAVIDKLEARLDYGHALTDPRQHSTIKVIYGGVGSIVKAAIVGKEIIDTSLYFFVPESNEEANYLVGILNSPFVTDFVNKVGSTGANGSLRNIHKHPFDLPWPKFDANNVVHQDVAHYAEEMIEYVHSFYQKMIQENTKMTKKMVQNTLVHDIKFLTKQVELNQIVKKIIHNG